MGWEQRDRKLTNKKKMRVTGRSIKQLWQLIVKKSKEV